ncbi:hypothetical protein CRUP_022445, partial [Coryphaenoides rupestris]
MAKLRRQRTFSSALPETHQLNQITPRSFSQADDKQLHHPHPCPPPSTTTSHSHPRARSPEKENLQNTPKRNEWKVQRGEYQVREEGHSFACRNTSDAT